MYTATWLGIIFCISQSAMFSGLNLAFFSISRLRLEIEASKNNPHALKILRMRDNANFLLTTILWGNVGINVLLTLLSNSVMAGITAFFFSTIIITFLGEIIPQAYFSRHAIRTASFFAPILKCYQILLYPVAKSSAVVLDKWLGPEAIQFFKEQDFQELLKIHIQSADSDVDIVEGIGALNFLALDDIPLEFEGEIIDPKSIIPLPFKDSLPIFPAISGDASDPFLKKLNESGKKWTIITDTDHTPKVVINSERFIREALFQNKRFNPYQHCHRPIIIIHPEIPLGAAMRRLKVHSKHADDDVIEHDIIIYWNDKKRIITGSDILGRLLRGIAKQENHQFR